MSNYARTLAHTTFLFQTISHMLQSKRIARLATATRPGINEENGKSRESREENYKTGDLVVNSLKIVIFLSK